MDGEYIVIAEEPTWGTNIVIGSSTLPDAKDTALQLLHNGCTDIRIARVIPYTIELVIPEEEW